MPNEIAQERLMSMLPKLGRVGAVIAFDLGAAGRPVVDARTSAVRLAEDDDLDPACTIRISEENLLKLLDGRLDPMLGYTMGKIKVVGSLGIAMKLIGALG